MVDRIITCRLQDADYQKLADIIDNYGMNKSQVIRNLINEVEINNLLSVEEKILLYNNVKELRKIGVNINQAIKQELFIDRKDITLLKAKVEENIKILSKLL